MLIGELADRTGVSARALRHYEERELLVPVRDSNGYRRYEESAVGVVQQIQTMVAAGLGTEMIRRYLDCARTDDHHMTLDMCPDLSASSIASPYVWTVSKQRWRPLGGDWRR